MSFKDIWEKVNKAQHELIVSGLEHYGYKVQVELDVHTYQKLCGEVWFNIIPNEDFSGGTIYGVPFIITQKTNRVLIARVIEE